MGPKAAPARLPLTALIHSEHPDDVLAAARSPELDEDLALSLLRRRDLDASALEALGRNQAVGKSRKVHLAVAQHPKTPRHVGLPLIRRMFTFDLMQLA